jgi:hypothetical protein
VLSYIVYLACSDFGRSNTKNTTSSRPAGPLTNFNVGALELGVFSIMAPNLRAFRVMFVCMYVRMYVCMCVCMSRFLRRNGGISTTSPYTRSNRNALISMGKIQLGAGGSHEAA